MGEIIRSGDEFRNPRAARIDEPVVDGYRNIKNVTRGRHATPGDFGKGMPRIAILKQGPRKGAVPATWFHSKEEPKEYPDILDIDSGYAMYYGDNGWKDTGGSKRPPHESAEDSYGISLLNEVEHLYFSDERSDRELAPPILITQEFRRGGLALRRFIGVGVLIGRETIDMDGGLYENVLYHVGLLELPDGMDWGWIDDLRDHSLGAEETFSSAPSSWIDWVEMGHEALSPTSIECSTGSGGAPRPPMRPDPLTVAEEREADDGSGYVYAITNRAWPGWVKIGRARDVRKRQGDYQTYSPKRDYKLKHAVRCEDRITAETTVHRHAALLAFGRRRCEWFRLTLGSAKTVLHRVGEPTDLLHPQLAG